MSTQAELEIKLFDVTAKEDATAACAAAQPFCDLTRLDVANPTSYATLERDYFRLDGLVKPFPDNPRGVVMGLWSIGQSDKDGRFAAPPVLRISFAASHSSVGLTLLFDPLDRDWCSRIRVRWLDGGGGVISAKQFTPTGGTAVLLNKVEGFMGLELEFLETSKPFRYLKLYAVDYGMRLLLSGEQLSSAAILEEIDLTAASVSVNTLQATICSETGEYSPLNPNGIFSVLQQGQRIDSYAIIDTKRQYMGSFYLDSWKGGQAGDLQLRAQDAAGQMDRVRFFGGVYLGITAQALLEQISATCGAQVTIDPALGGRRLWGYLPVLGSRAALSQVAFAVGGVVDTSRSDKISVCRLPERPSRLIGLDRKMQGQRLEQKKAVTAVELTVHSYVKSDEPATAFEGELPRGEVLVMFSEPVYNLTVTGATVLESGANHARLSVPAQSAVAVAGRRYIDNRTIMRRAVPGQGVNLQQNPARVENATLVTADNAGEVADRLVGYYRWRYSTEFSIKLGDERPADLLVVRNAQGDNLKGMVESMEVDLARGCIAGLRMAVNRLENPTQDYAGELRAGQWQGVL